MPGLLKKNRDPFGNITRPRFQVYQRVPGSTYRRWSGTLWYTKVTLCNFMRIRGNPSIGNCTRECLERQCLAHLQNDSARRTPSSWPWAMHALARGFWPSPAGSRCLGASSAHAVTQCGAPPPGTPAEYKCPPGTLNPGTVPALTNDPRRQHNIISRVSIR